MQADYRTDYLNPAARGHLMILFVDDDVRYMDTCAEFLRLELNCEVILLGNIDAAWELFNRRMKDINLVILDIMMPPGQFANGRTNRGLNTGFFFYEAIRQRAPELPIIVFTNVSVDRVDDRLMQDLRCHFLEKSDYLLDEFALEIKKILS